MAEIEVTTPEVPTEQHGFTHLECPDCGMQAVAPAAMAKKILYCDICAGDCGRDVALIARVALSTDKVSANRDWRNR